MGLTVIFYTFIAVTVDVLPIWVLMSGAVGAAGFMSYRAAKGPDVIWDKRNNPTPWNSIKPEEGVKLVQINVSYMHRTSVTAHQEEGHTDTFFSPSAPIR